MSLETKFDLDKVKYITRFTAIKLVTELTVKKWQSQLKSPQEAETLLLYFLLNGVTPIHLMSDTQLESKLKSLTTDIYLVIRESYGQTV